MSAGNIKPGNPGITGRAAGDFSYDFAAGPAHTIPDGARTVQGDGQGGTITLTLPKAEGYAGSMIALNAVVAASGNDVVVAAASGNTVNGLATLTLSADARLLLIPFGTNWFTVLSA